LSGGLDSAVTFYMARKDYECSVLVFNYGQRAVCEVDRAEKLAASSSSPCHVLEISLPWKGSALLDTAAELPSEGPSEKGDIPATYVPARNLIFLSFAASFAEAQDADAIFIGAHQLDFSNYPDCREIFFENFRETIKTGTKRGAEGRSLQLVTPILNMTKKEIVVTGIELGVPFEHTWSCYNDGPVPCGKCESCSLREKGFREAGVVDPILIACK